MDEQEAKVTLTQVRYEFLYALLKRMHHVLHECKRLNIADFIPLKRFAMELGFDSIESFHQGIKAFMECIATHPLAFLDVDTLAKEYGNNTIEGVNVFVARIRRIVTKDSKELEPDGESVQRLYQRIDEAVRDFIRENELEEDGCEIVTTQLFDNTGYWFCPKCNTSVFEEEEELPEGNRCANCDVPLVPHTQYGLFVWRGIHHHNE